MYKQIRKALRPVKRFAIEFAGKLPGLKKRRYCNICGRDSVVFNQWGIESPIFQSLEIVGGGVRSDCECPHCKSHDRFRWCYYLIEHHTNILTAKCSVLHIAPEPQIARKLDGLPNCEYITGDIVPGRAKMVVDVTDMPFENDRFDYIIMNHVLEHIPDERKAVEELKRCLKPGGTLMLSFPMSRQPHTAEETSPLTPQERLERFGQTDHCRLYGMDAQERLEGYGLKATPCTVRERLSQREYRHLGLIADDMIYLCTLA